MASRELKGAVSAANWARKMAGPLIVFMCVSPGRGGSMMPSRHAVRQCVSFAVAVRGAPEGDTMALPLHMGAPRGSRGATEPMSQTVSGRLKIGLSACFSHADPARSLFTNKTLQYVEQSITHWLMSAGAMVVMVPCPTGATARGDTKLSHYAEWLDGVVMHGGADVWPGSYGEVPLKDAWVGDRIRDLYDLALVEAFEQAGKPIFGVCRGLQLINVAFGGTLYQDIEAQHPNAQRHRDPVTYDQNFHQIEIVQGTRLSKLYPQV